MMDSNLTKSIFSGLIWKFGERILAQGVSFVITVVLSRLLLPDDYGVVAIVLIFINLANVFVTSGFNTALIQNKNATEIDFSTNFYCSLIVSFIIYAIMYFISPYISMFYEMPELTLIIRIFSLRLPLSAFSAIQHAYVERNMLFKRYFFSTLIGTVISGVVGIIFAYKGFGVWALIAQYFTNTIIDIIVLFFTVSWRPRLVFSMNSAKSMMGYGYKILLADLSGTFFDQLRSLIIGKVYTSSDLAYYNKGNQFPSLITTNISASVMTVLFPAISNINDEKLRVKELTRKSIITMAYIIFPLLVGLACVSKPMVIVLFTDKWIDAVPYIQILSLSCAVGLIGNISIQTIKAAGRSDIVLKMEFYKKPVYIILLILGTAISPIGVAVSMLLYNFYSVLVNSKNLSKIINYSINEQFSDLKPIFIMCIVMALFIYPLSYTRMDNLILLIIQVITGIFIYLFISVATKNEIFLKLKNLILENIRK